MFDNKSVEIVYYDGFADQLIVLESDVGTVTGILIGMFKLESLEYIGVVK